MKTEEIAQWYFRLNGFLTISNFVFHPLRKGGQRTDIDVVGIRFPHRREFETHPGDIDEPEFADHEEQYLVLTEVKSRWVDLNDSWRDERKHVLEDLLTSLGFFQPPDANTVAQFLRRAGFAEVNGLYCSLFFVGQTLRGSSPQLARVPHRTWADVLSFIYERFSKYGSLKTDTNQWDDTATELLAMSRNRTKQEFLSAYTKLGLPTG